MALRVAAWLEMGLAMAGLVLAGSWIKLLAEGSEGPEVLLAVWMGLSAVAGLLAWVGIRDRGKTDLAVAGAGTAILICLAILALGEPVFVRAL